MLTARQPLTPWLIPALLGGLLAFCCYSLPPLLNIDPPPLIQGFVGIFFILLAGLAWRFYWPRVMAKPFIFLYFILIGWPLVNYLSVQLIRTLGINLHLRPLLFLGLGIPAGMFFFKNTGRLLVCFPFLKYLIAFVSIVFLYFLCYNGMATDLGWMIEDFWSERSVPSLQMSSYLFNLMSILLTLAGVFYLQQPQQAFDRLNQVFVMFSSLLAGVIVLGYPFNFLTAVVDGFKRSEGLLDHPNPYAHHMGIVLIYLVGLLSYYQGQKSPGSLNRPAVLSSKWLLGAILLHLIAFLLGISKTAIFTLLLCLLVFGSLTLFNPQNRQGILKLGGLLLGLLPLGFMALQRIANQDFVQLLNSRVEDTKSLLWRTDIWNALLSDISGSFILWGHGFTAASTRIFQLTYNTVENLNPLILVHNGYLSLFYDFGLLGAFFFVAIGSLALQAFRTFRKTPHPPTKILMATNLTLCLYTLITCGFDEMTYMFDASMLFWVLCSLLLSLSMREGWSA